MSKIIGIIIVVLVLLMVIPHVLSDLTMARTGYGSAGISTFMPILVPVALFVAVVGHAKLSRKSANQGRRTLLWKKNKKNWLYREETGVWAKKKEAALGGGFFLHSNSREIRENEEQAGFKARIGAITVLYLGTALMLGLAIGGCGGIFLTFACVFAAVIVGWELAYRHGLPQVIIIPSQLRGLLVGSAVLTAIFLYIVATHSGYEYGAWATCLIVFAIVLVLQTPQLFEHGTKEGFYGAMVIDPPRASIADNFGPQSPTSPVDHPAADDLAY